MPYIPKPAPFARMARLLKGYGLNGAKMAKILDRSQPTGKDRIDHPGNLTLEELAVISSRAHIPMDEIRDAIIR